MKINKEFIIKNLITICCIASIVLLFLPFGKMVSTSKNFLGSESFSKSISGFDIIIGEYATVLAWILLICPIVLIAMNYIKKLDKYKSLLAIILPIISIITIICLLIFAGGGTQVSYTGASLSIKLVPHIGFFLLIISYIGTFIAGAITFHGLKFNKDSITEFGEKIKNQSAESVKGLSQKVAESAEHISQNIKNKTK